MKLPAKIRALRLGALQTQARELDLSEERRLAEHEAALLVKTGCAERLQPFIGRLMLVTNFKGYHEAEHAARITKTIAKDRGFRSAEVLGVSAHILWERRRGTGADTMLRSAQGLAELLNGSGHPTTPENVTKLEATDDWLLSIVSAAESTSRANPEASFGHIAIVGALDIKETKQADIDGYPDPGTAFLLAGIGENALLEWKIASFDPTGTYGKEQADRAELKDILERLKDIGGS
jgi:hypothetical protein